MQISGGTLILSHALAWLNTLMPLENIMIRHLATGLVIATIALAPAVAFAKTYKTEKSCVKHHMTWKDGKCVKA